MFVFFTDGQARIRLCPPTPRLPPFLTCLCSNPSLSLPITTIPLLPLYGTSERKARHLYYSDLRERVLRSECRQQEEVYFQLAGYAMQADLGDLPVTREDTEAVPYFEPKLYFPPWVGQRKSRQIGDTKSKKEKKKRRCRIKADAHFSFVFFLASLFRSSPNVV